eukprot:11224699-Lingulodinium_polyedra.AAC.1
MAAGFCRACRGVLQGPFVAVFCFRGSQSASPRPEDSPSVGCGAKAPRDFPVHGAAPGGALADVACLAVSDVVRTQRAVDDGVR